MSPGTTIYDVNWPAQNCFNAEFDFSRSRFFGNSGAFGLPWADERLLTSIKVTNLANHGLPEHIFGVVIKRQVASEARLTFQGSREAPEGRGVTDGSGIIQVSGQLLRR